MSFTQRLSEGLPLCFSAMQGSRPPTKTSIFRKICSWPLGVNVSLQTLPAEPKAEQKGLDEALQYCRPDDRFVFLKLDCLGRSLPHLVETVRDLVARGVGFKSLQENIDTTTSGGKLIFHIFASLAEFERDIIREWANAGLSAARERGRKGGRPKGVDEKKTMAALSLKKDLDRSVKEICEIVGISCNTYYKYTRSETPIRN